MALLIAAERIADRIELAPDWALVGRQCRRGGCGRTHEARLLSTVKVLSTSPSTWRRGGFLCRYNVDGYLLHLRDAVLASAETHRDSGLVGLVIQINRS